jgi:hypothetical protein
MAAAELALGRILLLGSRPAQPGDVAEYERCRAIILAELDQTNAALPNWTPNYARDRNRGAAGD